MKKSKKSLILLFLLSLQVSSLYSQEEISFSHEEYQKMNHFIKKIKKFFIFAKNVRIKKYKRFESFLFDPLLTIKL